uniref:Uncharacterized protein n=1 Tax=Anopheles quadriannulatus TaxID=34691 RepID=A0A182XRK5_ANOQN
MATGGPESSGFGGGGEKATQPDVTLRYYGADKCKALIVIMISAI